MKRTLTFLFCFSITGIFAQVYTPLPLQNGAWLQGLLGLIGPMYQAQIPGSDTIIGGQTYTNFYPNQPVISNWFAIRETPGHQVYIQYNGAPTEFLLYDFNLNPGDTFLCEACEYLYAQTCEWKLDSIGFLTFGGITRFAYYFTSLSPNYGGQQDVWIQGIGSTKGLSYAAVPDFPDNIHVLGCFEQAGEIIFTQPTGPPDPCALLTNISERQELVMNFLQQQSSGILWNSSKFKIHGIVTDLLGQITYSFHGLEPGKNLTLPLTKGINCITIQGENGQNWTKKAWVD